MNKVLTLIIPSYNMENYLNRCLSSLIVDDEHMKMFEALVVNDGSKDKTSEIGHDYETRYPDTFRVIDKENGHYGSCVNKGLEEAQGKYIKVLDADDFFHSDFSYYISFLKECDAGLVLTDSISVDEEGRFLTSISFNLPPLETGGIGILLQSEISCLNHFNITYRTDILKRISYHQTEGISYTDLEWSSLPITSISSVAYFPKVIYCYLRGREGQSVDISYRRNNMWMENTVVLGLAERYESMKDYLEQENSAIFRTFVSYFVTTVYRHYLIIYPQQLKESDLIDFDETLHRVSGEIYHQVASSREIRKFGSFQYIKDFRAKGTRKQLRFRYFDTCLAVASLQKKIRHQ